jgi:hypothetical protein
MSLGAVEDYTLLKMGASQEQFSLGEEISPQMLVGYQEESGILSTLRELEELFPKLP